MTRRTQGGFQSVLTLTHQSQSRRTFSRFSLCIAAHCTFTWNRNRWVKSVKYQWTILIFSFWTWRDPQNYQLYPITFLYWPENLTCSLATVFIAWLKEMKIYCFICFDLPMFTVARLKVLEALLILEILFYILVLVLRLFANQSGFYSLAMLD